MVISGITLGGCVVTWASHARFDTRICLCAGMYMQSCLLWGRFLFMDAKSCMIYRGRTRSSHGQNQAIWHDRECWILAWNLEKCLEKWISGQFHVQQKHNLNTLSVYAKGCDVLKKSSFTHLTVHLVITRYLKNRKIFFFLSFDDTKWIWIIRKGKACHLDFGVVHEKQDIGLIICIVRMDFLLSVSSSFCSSIRLYDKSLDVLAYIWDVKGLPKRVDQRQWKPSNQFRVNNLMVSLPPFSPKIRVYAFPKESSIACRYSGCAL